MAGQVVQGVEGNYIVLPPGTGPNFITLQPAAAPAAPSIAGAWTLYVDSGNSNELRAIASDGTIVTLGTP